MQWTMPRRALQIVAALIGLAAIGSFAAGVVNAPQRGRLPGERTAGTPAVAAPAAEATPLSQERIEGPPPPPELTPEEKAKLEAEKKAKAEAEAAAKAQAEAEAELGEAPAPTLKPPPPAPAAPPPPPPAEEPPF